MKWTGGRGAALAAVGDNLEEGRSDCAGQEAKHG